MTKPRVPETDHGIQGEITVAQYDQMQRSFRDKGWIETPALLKAWHHAGAGARDRAWPWLPGPGMAQANHRYPPGGAGYQPGYAGPGPAQCPLV